MLKIKKFISLLLISLILTFNISSVTLAEEPPTPPSAPDAPKQESISNPPENPLPPEAPKAPTAPEKTTKEPTDNIKDEQSADYKEDSLINKSGENKTAEKNPAVLENTPSKDQTKPNSNIGNGTDSENTNNHSSSNLDNNNQTNNSENSTQPASVVTTGGNTTSQNTGGKNNLITGDANSSTTVINALNTNVSGVDVAEFNISDNHTGDIILDFSTFCTATCSQKNQLSNSGNGSSSQNSQNLESSNPSNSFQSGNTVVTNDINLGADSGSNIASLNTGGNSSIITGDANVTANIATFANNNIAGNIVFGVVNIFGDLAGNIIMSEESLKALAKLNSNNQSTGNGSGSTNSTNTANKQNSDTFQTNDASIQNNLIFDTETGDNIAKNNTGGNSEVITGDANTNATVLNVANSNIAAGDTWWLVIINKAGKWVGKIMGAPEGSTMAGSSGTEFEVDDQGQVTASLNSGNGSSSDNSINSSNTTSQKTTQENKADIVNDINLSANTGKNITSDNTGGNSNIQTGDANIVANLVNFVNNNISGGGNLVVTLVNVFKSWIGDFIPPGQAAKTKTPQGQVAGVQNTPTPTPQSVIQVQSQILISNQPEKTVSSGQTIIQTYNSYINSPISKTPNQPSSTPNQKTGNRNFPQVAGVKTATANQNPQLPSNTLTLADNSNRNKVVRLNLAWLVVIIPGGIALYVVSRRYLAGRKI